MPKYLIEVPHEKDYTACVKALDAITSIGSHFVTEADWGCQDDVHTCWMVADLESRTQARQLVPPQFRGTARVVELCRFTREEISEMVAALDH